MNKLIVGDELYKFNSIVEKDYVNRKSLREKKGETKNLLLCFGFIENYCLPLSHKWEMGL
jgi:hypothetical protein